VFNLLSSAQDLYFLCKKSLVFQMRRFSQLNNIVVTVSVNFQGQGNFFRMFGRDSGTCMDKRRFGTVLIEEIILVLQSNCFGDDYYNDFDPNKKKNRYFCFKFCGKEELQTCCVRWQRLTFPLIFCPSRTSLWCTGRHDKNDLTNNLSLAEVQELYTNYDFLCFLYK
jgi:hypothetical protein